jgi:dethiobiotin synthase
VVSAALLCRYRDSPVRYWKPVQTGIEQDDDTAEVRRLSASPRERGLEAGIRLPRPVSPHLAARLNGTTIDLSSLVAIANAQTGDHGWIVEGAGGVLVPLNDQTLLIDLIKALAPIQPFQPLQPVPPLKPGLAVLIVARSGLGTINHTLLTIEALERRAIRIAGVVMVGAPDVENRRAIECYGRVAVVGELPMLDPLTPGTLERWASDSFDREGHLTEFLT